MNVIQKCTLPQILRVLVAGHLADPVIEAGRRSRTRRRATARSGSGRRRSRCCARSGRCRHWRSTTPVTPPTVNTKMKPTAHSIGVFELDRTAPHCRDPGEDLDARRHRDDQRRGHEVGAGVDVDAGHEHVVRPHHEADHADRDHGVGHAEIAEDRLAAERRDHVADDPEARQDHDVDFWVAEEPEQVLEQHRIAAAGRIEERGAEIAVADQHGDRAGQHRNRQHQQKRRHQLGPDEQRHLVQRHAGGSHVEDRHDEIHRAQQRTCTGKVEREQRAVHSHAGLVGRVRQRRIQRPAGAGLTHQQSDA